MHFTIYEVLQISTELSEQGGDGHGEVSEAQCALHHRFERSEYQNRDRKISLGDILKRSKRNPVIEGEICRLRCLEMLAT